MRKLLVFFVGNFAVSGSVGLNRSADSKSDLRYLSSNTRRALFRRTAKKIFATIALCTIVGSAAHAQFKINGNKRAFIGSVPANHDPDGLVTLSLYGTGANGGSAMLAFGDFGASNGGQNVFIGEGGSTDRLWLHGKNGIYITDGAGSLMGGKIVFQVVAGYNPVTRPTIFDFYTSIDACVFFSSSDSRFKSNIAKIQTPLNKLLSLDGVSYDFDPTLKMKFIGYNESSPIQADSVLLTNVKKEAKMGFIAQDLQKIFPNLVREDDMGFLSIDYMGLIPVVVEAMKEQQTQIENLQRETETLRNALAACCDTKTQKSLQPFELTNPTGANTEELKVYQNVPNPFNENTVVRCYIPKGIQKAELCVYDMQGSLLKCFLISERGATTVQIQAGQLSAGVYTYLLIGDDKTSDAKQMILTK